MKFVTTCVFAVSLIGILSGCAKESSGGGGSTLIDVKQFKVESLTEEQPLTDTEFQAQSKSQTANKACRNGLFGVYKKGDKFVTSYRSTFPSPGSSGPIKSEFTVVDTVVSIDKKMMLVQRLVETASDSVASLKGTKSNRKCVAVNGKVKCSSGFTGGNDCQLKDESIITRNYSKGFYTLQNGRKVPVLVTRSQSKFLRECKAQVSEESVVTTVNVATNAIKDVDGKSCSNASEVNVYSYAGIQSGDGAPVVEMDITVQAAPAL